MSTDLKREIISTSSEQTRALGERIGGLLRGGEVLQLTSDLGGGKTTLTKGITAGAGYNGVVASPTFTISREYDAPHFIIRHFDFYRLSDPGIVALELGEDLNDPRVVTIIEWADIVQDILPSSIARITIITTGESGRCITIEASPQTRHILGAFKI